MKRGEFKGFLTIVLIAATIFVVTGCGGGNSDAGEGTGGTSGDASQGDVVEFTYSGTLPKEHFLMELVDDCAATLKEKSGGRLIMNVFYNNELADSRQSFEAMQNGSIQMGEMATAPVSGFTAIFEPVNLPFFWSSDDEAIAFMNSDFALKTLGDRLAAEQGVRPVGFFYNGPRSLSNSKHEIRTPGQVKGLKIRVLESPIYIQTFQALGAAPTPMSFAELFTGLQQGTIDGQDNGPTIMVTNKIYEVQKYYTDINYIYDVGPCFVSEKFYKSLPDDLRLIFDEVWSEIIDISHRMSVDAIERDIKTMEDSGVKITRLTDAERAAFREAVESVYTWFKSAYPDYDLDAYQAAGKS
jgi:C4-dicarboxylate-binding protein DctP